MTQGLKIVRFTAENVKRLKLVTITPKGSIVPITGANGQGKSSVLDSIWWALGGKENITSVPVRKGADKGIITLDLGDFVVERVFTTKKKCAACKGTGKEILDDLKLTPRECDICNGSGFIAENGTEVTVRAPSAVAGKPGPKYDSPQVMLNALVNGLSFDPLEFARGSAPEQFDILRKAVAIEFDFDGIAKANSEDYKERTRLNKEAKQSRAIASSIAVPDGTPAEPVDVEAINKRIRDAFKHNSDIATQEGQRSRARDGANQRLVNAQREGDRISKEIDRLQAQLADQTEIVTGIHEELTVLDHLPPLEAKIEVKDLEAKLETAKGTNLAVTRRLERDDKNKSADVQETAATELTTRMEEREHAKVAAIAGAKMPVEGLGLGDGFVTFNGIPFDQASDAERLRVSLGIAMATNPKLRVIRIRDGSLLDENSMKIIGEMAKDKGFQFWVEVVSKDSPVGIVLEDGEVKADNQVEEKVSE